MSSAQPINSIQGGTPATIIREVVPSASRHVALALVLVPGPTHTIEPEPYLRLSYNMGPSYSFDVTGAAARSTFSSRRHSLLVIPPNVGFVHRSNTPKLQGRPYKPARLATFRITPELLVDCAIALGLPNGKARLRHQVIPSDEVLRLLAQALFADLRAQSPDGAQATERLAMALVTRLMLREQGLAAGTARPGLEQVRAFIGANLHTPLALEQLAALAGMSVFHFCRVFRESVGMTAHQYIVSQRIEQAKRLLWTNRGEGGSSMSMLDIALACGFNTPSHFAAQFKRHTGLTPLQWQRKN